jgi:Thiol:disulfide interchange protein
MGIMELLEAMGTSNIPLLAAFFIGLLMAFAPCPMATNIAAIAYISRRFENHNHTVWVGILYSLGRMVTYVGLTFLIVSAGLNIQAVSFFLQDWGEKLLGPFLVFLGILTLEIVEVPSLSLGSRWTGLREGLAERGYLGSFLLGILFALSFCPFSAVLFFGMLLPLSFAQGDPLLLPAVFAFATGLPVILVSLLLVKGVRQVTRLMSSIQGAEAWMKRIVAALFLGIGIYYIVVVYVI